MRHLVIRLDESTIRGALLCVSMGCLAMALGVGETVARKVLEPVPTAAADPAAFADAS